MIATQLFTLFSLISLAGARPTCKTHKSNTTQQAVSSYSSTSLNSTSYNVTSYNVTSDSASTSSTAASSAVISVAAVWATPSAQAEAEEIVASSSTWSSAAVAATSDTSSSGGAVSGGFSGTATYYAAGLGACGWTNSGSDFVVAMNAPQYSGNNCGKNVKITDTVTGNTATAQIADLCPGCAYGDLDMSTSLFSNLHNGNMDAGVFSIKWEFA